MNKEINIQKPVFQNGYNVVGFFALLLLMAWFAIIVLVTSPVNNLLTWCLIPVYTVAGISVAAYIYLNKAVFYDDHIEVTYTIKHASKKKQVIPVRDILGIEYSGGLRGTTGKLKVYYTEGGRNKIVRLVMHDFNAVKVCKAMKAAGKVVELEPRWAFDGLGGIG